MTPLNAFVEVLARIAASREVFLTEAELDQWPARAVLAMKAQHLIAKAAPAISAICPGCEENCAMPVETVPVRSAPPALFVVCDKRSDINRVAIPAGQLAQWQASMVGVGKFIAENLAMRWQGTTVMSGDVLEIGIVKAARKSQMLCLRSTRGLVLVAGTSELPLIDIVAFADGRYLVDSELVDQLVNNSTTSDARYTPSNARREAGKLNTKARIESWRKEYRRRKKRHPDRSDRWCAIQISKMDIGEGRSSETIRKNMK